MRPICLLVTLLVSLGITTIPRNVAAQSAEATPAVPTLVPLTGQLTTATGEPRTGSVLLVVAAYAGKNDATPLWIENQMVTLDAAGRYGVQFGGTQATGLPADLFAAGEARWIGITVEQEPEQPRFMLLSVPYAAKAVTADTLSGKTAADFVLASNLTDAIQAALQTSGGTPDGGAGRAMSNARGTSSFDGVMSTTSDYLTKFADSGGTLTDSSVINVNGKVGIGLANPGAGLHVHNAAQTFNAFRLSHSSSGSGSDGLELTMSGQEAYVWNYESGRLRFGTNGLDRLAIQTNGHVGIGTLDPGARLHVHNADANFTALRLSHNLTSPANGLEFGASTDLSTYIWSYHNAPLSVATNSTERMRITGSGDVGIGTTTPTAKLDVIGNVKANGNITATGDISANGTIFAKYQDVAEWVDATDALEPGTLVIVDATATNRVTTSTRAYDSRVAGAVSPQPGLILGEPGEGKELVAQSGRVRI